MNGGRPVTAFFAEVDAYLKGQAGDEGMIPYVNPVRDSLGHLQQATMWLGKNTATNPEEAGAASYDYMELFGLVAFGYMWCRVIEAARRKTLGGSTPHLSAKLGTGRFFVERVLPETSAQLTRIKKGASSTMGLPAEAF